jgi:hypothetical protein
MKFIYTFLFLFFINNISFSQELNRTIDTSEFGLIIALLNSSSLNSGTITFKKDGTSTTYEYKDDTTSIRVESIHGRFQYEYVYFDTTSPEFQLFNIRVGTSTNDVIRELGNPLNHSNTRLEYTTTGYFLIFHIANNRVTRIIYNPFE